MTDAFGRFRGCRKRRKEGGRHSGGIGDTLEVERFADIPSVAYISPVLPKVSTTLLTLPIISLTASMILS